MKKLQLLVMLFFICATAYPIIHWQPYPITTAIKSNGTQQRLECSVYDSLLGSWVFYNTPYFKVNHLIDTSNSSSEIIVFGIYLPPHNYDSIYGYIIYDQELHQFAPVITSHSDPDYPGVNIYTFDGIVAVETWCCYDPWEFEHMESTYGYFYDIKNHSWNGGFLPAGSYPNFAYIAIRTGGFVITTSGDNNYNPREECYYYDPVLHNFSGTNLPYTDGVNSGGDQDLYISYNDPFVGDESAQFNAFDPTLHSWNYWYNEYAGNYINGKGIFYNQNFDTGTNYFGIYDDSLHQWAIDSTNLVISSVKIKDRVVAYVNANQVYYEVFSPSLRAWVKDSSTVVAGIDSIYIEDGTVHWVDNNSVNFIAGYADTSGWGNFNTPLHLNFHLIDFSSLTGDPLIFVRNYSIGADSVMYDFGDGITTGYHQSSLWHQFKINGQYSAVQNANYNICISTFNGSGFQSSCQNVSYFSCSVSGIASSTSNSLCIGDSNLLTLTGYTGAIQWQSNVAGSGTWVNETGPGFNSDTYLVTPGVTTYYRARVTDTCSAVFSNHIGVTVFPLAVVGTATAVSDTSCSNSNASLFLIGSTGAIQWQSFDGTNWVNETGPGSNSSPYEPSPTVFTQYRAVVSSGVCLNDTSGILSVNVVPVTDPITVNDTICGPGVVNLSASGTGVVNWLTSITGGTYVNTGPVYSPNISSTTTWYVHTSPGGIVSLGPPYHNIGSHTPSAVPGWGLQFDVTQLCTIEKVLVIPRHAGNVTINLRDSTGFLLNSVTESILSGIDEYIDLGFTLDSSSGYRLELGPVISIPGVGSPLLSYNTSNAVYPYTATGSPITITGCLNPNFNTGGTYCYFYDWQVIAGCKSNLIPVTGVIAPLVSAITPNGPLSFCQGGSVLLSANPGTGLAYQWTRNGIPIIGAISQNYLATTAGMYHVIISDASCTDTSLSVTVSIPCYPPIDPELKTGNENSEEINPELFVYYHSVEQTAFINAQKLKGKNYVLHVYDLLGKELFKENGKLNSEDFTKDLNCALLAKGMYLVSLQAEKDKLIKRFVKD